MTFGVAVKAYIFKDNKLLVIYKTEAEAQGNLKQKIAEIFREEELSLVSNRK